tara:strand:- start:677 stop:1015 length:339 start_codon:yes stop_codon:yes gene_type:complete
MLKIKLIIPILIFSVLLAFTSIIKNKTRVIEKKIDKVNKNILSIKHDLHETQLDFFYVSTPNYLLNKIQQIALIDYVPMDFSKIYFNYNDFIKTKKNMSNLKIENEKKKQKK